MYYVKKCVLILVAYCIISVRGSDSRFLFLILWKSYTKTCAFSLAQQSKVSELDQWSLLSSTPRRFTIADDQFFIMKQLKRKLEVRFPDALVETHLVDSVEAYQNFRDVIVPHQSHAWDVVILDQVRLRVRYYIFG